MKTLLSFILVLTLANGALANTTVCKTYSCKKQLVLEDKSYSENVRKELQEYFKKSDELYQDCKLKRKNLKAGLSKEAYEVLHKHHVYKSKTKDVVVTSK